MIRLISPRKRREYSESAYRLCHASVPVPLQRDEVALSIQEQIDAIEPGVQVIGSGLPTPRMGRVDLVGEDVAGRLVAISVCRMLDARELCDCLLRIDWMRENALMLEHLYGRPMPSGKIRSWIMAEAVQPELSALLNRMNGERPELFRCEGMELGDERFVVVRRVLEPQPEKSAAPALAAVPPAPETAGRPVQLHSVLSRQEIDEFFASPGEIGEAEEVTGSEELPPLS